MDIALTETKIHLEIESVRDQIITLYSPSKIILFGSRVKGTARSKSDIDLCLMSITPSPRFPLLPDGPVRTRCHRRLRPGLYPCR